MRTARYVIFLALLGALPGAAWAQAGGVEARLERIERLLESQSLGQLLLQLEALQREVQELRGEVEQQGHLLEQLRQRQRDLYLDTDRRLLQLERAQQEAPGFPTVSPPGGEAGAASGATPDAPRGEADGAAGQQQAARAPATSASAGTEQEAYQAAFDLLRELRYEQAVEAFGAFLQQYPRGRYAHMAQYWIAEAHYAQRRFPQAVEQYQALLKNYPNSPKVPEALLKIGYSHYELGQAEQAREVVQSLVQRHPGTTEAGQGETLLEQIRSGGR